MGVAVPIAIGAEGTINAGMQVTNAPSSPPSGHLEVVATWRNLLEGLGLRQHAGMPAPQRGAEPSGASHGTQQTKIDSAGAALDNCGNEPNQPVSKAVGPTGLLVRTSAARPHTARTAVFDREKCQDCGQRASDKETDMSGNMPVPVQECAVSSASSSLVPTQTATGLSPPDAGSGIGAHIPFLPGQSQQIPCWPDNEFTLSFRGFSTGTAEAKAFVEDLAPDSSATETMHTKPALISMPSVSDSVNDLSIAKLDISSVLQSARTPESEGIRAEPGSTAQSAFEPASFENSEPTASTAALSPVNTSGATKLGGRSGISTPKGIPISDARHRPDFKPPLNVVSNSEAVAHDIAFVSRDVGGIVRQVEAYITSAHPATRGVDPFAVLEGAPTAPPGSWIHAGTHHAEAGYLDPALGWIGVRADVSHGAVHASLVPGSAEAAQVLGSQLAGLNAYLSEHHSDRAAVSVAALHNEESQASFGNGSGDRPSGGREEAPSAGGFSDGPAHDEVSSRAAHAAIGAIEARPPTRDGKYISVVA